jgi:CheY-like chemotaxis protein/two-component sensor histidine kinase
LPVAIVRNPVAAAMAATNFVKLEIAKKKALTTDESIEQAREDVNIIDNALHFINDLLRNMLDMHRAASKQLQITKVPTDILHDVLEPVAAMLYRGRNSHIKIIIECDPKALYVDTDPLRLKQVILNLGRNSIKFIDEGFIRLRAEEIDGNVRLFVDDSGSGIPKEKRQRLFAKFQESLDALSQGTGIGLHLCQNLVDLMGGSIYLDEAYNSGIVGHPGTRFVVDLQTSSIEPPTMEDLTPTDSEVVKAEFSQQGFAKTASGSADDDDTNSLPTELPDELSVLFIDDDFVLRKLFVRAIRAVAPGWSIREAANGETAIRLFETDNFDLIFCDMYMASVEKQLLGTETISELRNMGCTCRCVGLSANDKEEEFLNAGADAFIFKPMPCDVKSLKATLLRVLYDESRQTALVSSKVGNIFDGDLLPDV